MRFVFLVISLIALLSSCKKDATIESPPDLGYDYFPVQKGKYIVYDVDSIKYRAIEGDTIHAVYRIKEELDSVFTDNQGRPTYKMIRYVKVYNPAIPYDSVAWTIKDVWAVNRTSTTAEVVEENVRYIKLTFPVVSSTSWNGNAQNTLEPWDYKYTELNGQEVINNRTYSQVITVTQKNYITALGKQVYIEKYAKGIGMIYKEISDYSFKIDNGVLQPGVISEGLIYKMNIVDYHL